MRFRIVLIALVLTMLFPSVSYASGNENLSSISQDPAVKSVISQYFDDYFSSYETLGVVTSDIVEENDNTMMYEKIHELAIEANKAVNLKYKNVKVTLDYQNITYSDNQVDISLLMNCDYAYSSTPTERSAIRNVDYKFSLARKNDKLKIISIDSNFDEYTCFKNSVEEKVASNINRLDAIKKTKDEKSKEIQDTLKYFDGNAQISNVAKQTSTLSTSQLQPFAVTATYTFNRMLGRNWAQRFAEAPSSSRFFYTVSGNDCTNFVSQCIWAGYGGYIEGNDSQTKSNINNQVRMTTSGNWYAGTGGGSGNWESVTNLWNYVTSNTGYGPKATGSNNNQPYYNLSPSSIYYGNALQIRTGSSGDYGHSVFVTYSLDSGTQYYNQVLVSQHTYDKYNRNLWELITAWGGDSCYVRKMSFNSASFSN